jgi:7-carboxy-7-deazaguanine synthase
MTMPQVRNRGRDAGAPAIRAGHLSEMFCSVQGEGPFVGERQIFLRTAGCTATCSWCDTVYSKVQTRRFVLHSGAPGSPRWRPNPVGLEDVLGDVETLARHHAPVSTVSITGGEPLEQPEFTAALARALRSRGFRIYLETAGIHGDALRTLIDAVDVVAMDIKLPSATGVDHWDAHRDFLAAARGNPAETGLASGGYADPTIFVKVVVDLKATVDEIERAAGIVAACDPAIPLILQPESETLFGRASTRDRSRALLELIDAAARSAAPLLRDVRVIPQTHRMLDVR